MAGLNTNATPAPRRERSEGEAESGETGAGGLGPAAARAAAPQGAMWGEALEIITDLMKDLAELRGAMEAQPGGRAAPAVPEAAPEAVPEIAAEVAPEAAAVRPAPAREARPTALAVAAASGTAGPRPVLAPERYDFDDEEADQPAGEPGPVVARLAAGAEGAHIFALVDEEGQRVTNQTFEIIGDEIRIRTGARIDFAANPTHELLVLVADSRNNQRIETVTVNVTPAEPAPTGRSEAEDAADEPVRSAGAA